MVDFTTPIAIVDDDAQMRRMMRSMLRKIGFQEVAEDDGRDPMGLLHSRAFGLILSDLMMKPMNGLQLLKNIRADRDLSSVPFIMVTGAADMHLVTTALELGVDAYLVKPFNTRTFERRIVGVLELAGMERTSAREKPGALAGKLDELTNQINTLLALMRAQLETGAHAPTRDIIALIRGYLDSAVALGIDETRRIEFEALLAGLGDRQLTQTPNLNAVLLTDAERRQQALAASDRRNEAQTAGAERRSGGERRCHIRFATPVLHVGLAGRIYLSVNWSIGGFCIAGFGARMEPGQEAHATFAIEGVDDIEAVYSAQARILRCDPLTGTLVGRFKSHVSPTLKLLEYMTRNRLTPVAQADLAQVDEPASEI